MGVSESQSNRWTQTQRLRKTWRSFFGPLTAFRTGRLLLLNSLALQAAGSWNTGQDFRLTFGSCKSGACDLGGVEKVQSTHGSLGSNTGLRGMFRDCWFFTVAFFGRPVDCQKSMECSFEKALPHTPSLK